MSFVLAHLSDAHLGPIPRPHLRELIGKRLTGYLNWLSNRGRTHDMGVLARLVADMAAQQPDHVAMTGDIVNIGLAAEFVLATSWLASLGAPSDVSFTPGNHDAYVRASMPYVESVFAPWTASEETGGTGFPFLRRRGGVALIGLCSGVPTAPFIASGRLGAAQRQQLAALLQKTKAEGLARVVMLHHPPHRLGARRGRGLQDAREVEAIIARHGAELVLHGHNHKLSVHHLAGPDGPVPVVGAASASARPGAHTEAAAYNLFSIERRGGRVAIAARSRGIAADGLHVRDLGEIEL
ncbi:MAG: metallophosphoesterase [Methylocystis sp.]|nr:metallophosphoesterase [Methylocystis sp.]MBI3275492.1 metallophosphoesterase [Methylocystis sp.]